MTESGIQYTEKRNFSIDSILNLYKANEWSAAEKPQQLYDGLMNSHYLVSAWDGDRLVGLGNAISDSYLVVYYPHLLVLPTYQKQGVGYNLLHMLTRKYKNFHQRILVADNDAVGFYKKCGFERAGKTQPMWIYQGK
ncbi:MAG: GNAT family N-acetyltransferase [Mastigocoleus sp. MO_167.B18]|nr:GNAT family N-acetyltransferase [Mastigocoleus sp. MO_167.B18]